MLRIMFRKSTLTLKASFPTLGRFGRGKSMGIACLLPLILLFVISCRSVGSYDNKSDDSQLTGVYDETTLLRLSAAPEKPGLFRFEACLKDYQQHMTVAKEGSCIGALRSLAGEDITFTLASLETNSLDDDEKAYLQDLQSDWYNYQKKLRAGAERTSAGVVAIGLPVAVGTGGAAYTSRQQRVLAGLLEDLQKLTPESAEAIRSELTKIEQKLRGAGLGAALEDFEGFKPTKGLKKASGDLSPLAGTHPAGFVVGEAAEIGSVVGQASEKSILTPEFRSFFRKSVNEIYLDLGGGGIEAIKLKPAKLNEIVGAIVAEYRLQTGKKSLHDIFEPRWLGGFFKYQGIEAAMGGEPTLLMRNADELTAALKKAPAQVLQSAQEYVFHEAISPAASKALYAVSRRRALLNYMKRSAAELSQEVVQAQRNIRLGRIGIILAVVAAAGSTFAVLRASTDDLQAPLVSASQLAVLMNKSGLMSQDPTNNTQVSSVQQVLEGLSEFLKLRAAVDESYSHNLQVHHYCWPASRGQGNKIRAQCQRVAPYR